MAILKKVLLGLVALVVLLIVIGFLLPRTFKVVRSVEIAAPMEKVYPLVYDPKAWARWGVWSRRDPGMTMTYTGTPAGVGAKWSWKSKAEGDGTMEFTAAEFNKLVGYTITFPDMDMQGTGKLEFAQVGASVRVTWTGEGDVGANPISHYFAAFMDRMLGPDFEGGLNNLKALAEQKVS